MGSTFENLQTVLYNINSDNIYSKTKMLSSKVAKLCSSRLGLLTVSRLLSSSTIRSSKNIPAGFAKRKEIQKMFNIDNGLRVHQRGKGDSLLYNLTLLVVIIGGIEFPRVVYLLSFPES